MEQRAAIPPGLPRPNPTTSYWQEPLSSIATWPNGSGNRSGGRFPLEADIVIVGSGITGSTLAYSILNATHPKKVLMLEARTACSGATGRNGGHTKPHSYREFLANLESMGEPEATKILRFKFKCMKTMHAFARDHGIDCDSWEGDTVDVYFSEWHFSQSVKAIKKIRSVFPKDEEAAQYQIWNSDEVREKFRVENAVGAVSYAAGSMNAYKFGTGILRLAVDKGLDLWTGTPALGIQKPESASTGRWVVRTPKGNVTANRVVLATNGYTAHLYPALQGTIVPLRGHMTAQRPGTKLPAGTLEATYSFLYDDGYEYMIFRPMKTDFAGDICIGGGTTKGSSKGVFEYGNTDDTTVDPEILAYLKASAKGYFGDNWGDDHPEGRLRKAWTGIMGYSADGFPLVGEIPHSEGLYVAASFQGSGMVLCFLSAMALVLMMEGKDDQILRSWFPQAFRMGPDRLGHKFRGRSHTAPPADLEIKSQS